MKKICIISLFVPLFSISQIFSLPSGKYNLFKRSVCEGISENCTTDDRNTNRECFFDSISMIIYSFNIGSKESVLLDSAHYFYDTISFGGIIFLNLYKSIKLRKKGKVFKLYEIVFSDRNTLILREGTTVSDDVPLLQSFITSEMIFEKQTNCNLSAFLPQVKIDTLYFKLTDYLSNIGDYTSLVLLRQKPELDSSDHYGTCIIKPISNYYYVAEVHISAFYQWDLDRDYNDIIISGVATDGTPQVHQTYKLALNCETNTITTWPYESFNLEVNVESKKIIEYSYEASDSSFELKKVVNKQ